MTIKFPQNDHSYFWTVHCKQKMLQYGFGAGVVKRVTRFPDRIQEGVAKNTVAMMRRRDTKTSKREFWVMYQMVGRKKKMISCWIYPGVSFAGKQIFIPDDTLVELEKMKLA